MTSHSLVICGVVVNPYGDAITVSEREEEEETTISILPRFRTQTPPEIQVDLVGSRTPSPEEVVTYIVPEPSTRKKVVVLHEEPSESDGETSTDASPDSSPHAKLISEPPSQQQDCQAIADLKNDPELREFAVAYIKGILEQAQVLAQERAPEKAEELVTAIIRRLRNVPHGSSMIALFFREHGVEEGCRALVLPHPSRRDPLSPHRLPVRRPEAAAALKPPLVLPLSSSCRVCKLPAISSSSTTGHRCAPWCSRLLGALSLLPRMSAPRASLCTIRVRRFLVGLGTHRGCGSETLSRSGFLATLDGPELCRQVRAEQCVLQRERRLAVEE
ncbi:hypothetical protein HPB51_010129 [Rhipicephalus microplus]|uniref:Uncharacterized protein n=1 Tax=Rhipicephalus microplus TaxID=6941 RepID=A0A9J6F1Z6_RHIMP|nr:hypothetical protein HPB51_010129 [Rhipicephalus microplus]